MEIDKSKVRACAKMVEKFYDMAKQSEEIDENKIDELIKLAISYSTYKFSIEEIALIKAEVEYNCETKHDSDGVSITNDYAHCDWYIDWLTTANRADTFFWDRYRDFLLEKQDLSLNIVNKLDNSTLVELMNYLGDPNSEECFLRRGLIIGDVQSGKTSTYIGLLCKAADAGYKVVILLTGTIENLRNQTQKRVEEGFVGIDISQCANGAAAARVGVGKDGKPIKVTAMTSRDYDFVGNMNRITTSLENHKVVLCVIKKNTTVLTKLINWLVTLNADSSKKGKIPFPMLLIDDEADNASINTNKPEEDPTRINSLIRKLADSFWQTTYIGFTATPFANVFISPDSPDEMQDHDLFPENFIYCLPTPSNYIGAQKIFFEDGIYQSSVKYITDAGIKEVDGYSFYYSHNKYWEDSLPNSLTDSIYTFLLANAIRDLRRDLDMPRTMMINVSRFINVQYYTKEFVEAIYKKAYDAIKYDLSTNFKMSMLNPILEKIYNIWNDEYNFLEFTWNEVVNVIFKAIEHIQIRVVNSSKKSEKLDYEHNPCIRLIVIGGLVLSRGLTLEGLLTSYFYRNTSTYDVLMQMGRWFGYRKNYDDIFRIWTSKQSADWYSEICESTELLKDDISTMRECKLTPKDFGMRVRNDSKELRITAPNKMRAATEKIEVSSFFGDMYETPYLTSDNTINDHNLSCVKKFTKMSMELGCAFKRLETQGNHYSLMDTPKKLIIWLINEIKISKYNRKFDTDQIYKFLLSCSEDVLEKWDIVFMEGERKNNSPYPIENHEIYPIKRDFSVDEYDGKINIGSRGKLAGTSDGRQCLEDHLVIAEAKRLFAEDYLEQQKLPWKEGRSFPTNTWFKHVEKRKPLLIIYLIKLDALNGRAVETQVVENFTEPFIGFAMGIPKNKNQQAEQHKYIVNPTYTQQQVDTMSFERSEEE